MVKVRLVFPSQGSSQEIGDFPKLRAACYNLWKPTWVQSSHISFLPLFTSYAQLLEGEPLHYVCSAIENSFINESFVALHLRSTSKE
jgi:hypothetical protein